MKAVLCKQWGPPEQLVIEDVDSPKLGANGVRIAVHAAGVNFPDTLIIEQKYQFKPPLPFSPGGELSGTVLEVGDKVKLHKPGDRVVGINMWGAFAEEVVLPETNVLPMPEGLGFEEAAGFVMTYGTSLYALKQRGRLQEGETLLVLGAAGGVGLAAVELGKLLGATVIACASSEEKLAVCREKGADHTINYSQADLREEVKKLTGGKGADVIYDPVGGDLFDQAIRAVNWDARILIIGFASGRIPDFPVNRALIKSCAVIGVFWGASLTQEPQQNQQNFVQLHQWVAQGKLKPHISRVLPMEQVADALGLLSSRQAVGKIVLQIQKGA